MHVHPKGTQAKVLLSSVFGPYAQDDEFGSRSINPMELYHNQVTRAQGAFSIRMFHRSWGILMIQHNIHAPCTVLDFPTREAFIAELRAHDYDIVGISSIIVNVGKVREMCRIVREVSPNSVILVGGHVAAIPGLERMIDADFIVKGDGISWMRAYLGEDPEAPIQHPEIISGFDTRVLGVKLPQSPEQTAATIIPSVGCPMGCNFCTTSAFFGGKGRYLNFFDSGDELYEVMEATSRKLGCRSFFVMDENFLLQKKRTLDLLHRIRQNRKAWSFYVFSSANAIRQYSMEELVELGISWIWMGLESPRSSYSKLNGVDTLALTRELRENGIRTLGSTIIGLEHHTRENIRDEIEYAVRHDTDFHQFMLYTPVPGTPLYQQVREEGRLIDVDLADIHGQYKFNFAHPAISRDDSKRFLDYAFQRDFERNGPSLYRISRTTFNLWKKYRNHADERVRDRVQWEVSNLKSMYAAALWAMERKLRGMGDDVSMRIRRLRKEIEREFGLKAKAVATLLGPILWWTSHQEERRLEKGVTYEPPTFVERRNWQQA